LIVVVDCLRRRKRATAGEVQATVSFGCPMLYSILCGIWQKKNIRESAGKRGKDWETREGADSPGSVGFIRELPQVPAAPASDSSGLAASRVLEEEGKCRGGSGLLIGAAW
jgi:hypothetical protein